MLRESSGVIYSSLFKCKSTRPWTTRFFDVSVNISMYNKFLYMRFKTFLIGN